MAWTAPRTWVSGEIVTAALMNTHVRDNLLALAPLNAMAWTDYSASFAWTMSTSGTVTDTVDYAKYYRLANAVWFQAQSTVSSVSSPTGNCLFSVPVTMASATTRVIGHARVYDNSTAVLYNMQAVVNNTTTVYLQYDATTNITYSSTAVPGPPAASDIVSISLMYESA